MKYLIILIRQYNNQHKYRNYSPLQMYKLYFDLKLDPVKIFLALYL